MSFLGYDILEITFTVTATITFFMEGILNI